MVWSCLSPSTSHLAIKRLPGILHGLEILLLRGALCHLLLIDLLDVGLNPPDVAQGVAHTTPSVPPEQAGHLGDGDGSSREGLLVDGIGIFDIQTRGAQGVSGHPSLASKPPTIESPILASACPIVPSSLYMRESSCAPNACFRKSRSLAVSREIIQGITLEEPSGIGGTAFGCGVIFMVRRIGAR